MHIEHVSYTKAGSLVVYRSFALKQLQPIEMAMVKSGQYMYRSQCFEFSGRTGGQCSCLDSGYSKMY